MKKINYFTRVL